MLLIADPKLLSTFETMGKVLSIVKYLCNPSYLYFLIPSLQEMMQRCDKGSRGFTQMDRVEHTILEFFGNQTSSCHQTLIHFTPSLKLPMKKYILLTITMKLTNRHKLILK